jgi:hypothetical protein
MESVLSFTEASMQGSRVVVIESFELITGDLVADQPAHLVQVTASSQEQDVDHRPHHSRRAITNSHSAELTA